jgi:membrane protein DedA with SNARE-associated domain
MADWITNTMQSLGYVGIGLLMFLENLFPPIPSELIMPLAGFTAQRGEMSLWGAILAGSLGALLGALPWYYIGYFVGEDRLKAWADRYGRWLTISSKEIEKADRWFDRYAGKAVLIGRLIPGIRTLISLPAGFSEMHLLPFLVYTSLGTLLWTSFLTLTGYFLSDNYQLVDEYLGPVSKIIFASVLAFFILWVIRRRQRHSA